MGLLRLDIGASGMRGRVLVSKMEAEYILDDDFTEIGATSAHRLCSMSAQCRVQVSLLRRSHIRGLRDPNSVPQENTRDTDKI